MILGKYDSSSADVVLSGFTKSYMHNDDLLKESLRILKPKGILVIHEAVEKSKESDFSSQVSKLKLNGFLQNKEPKAVTSDDGSMSCEIVAEKPSYEVCWH